MSLPLTRRIAKTVLLTAAGAASVVGTAGAASAAELPTTADVGGLSKLDDAVGNDVSGAASKGAKALTPMSSSSPLDTATSTASGVDVGTDARKVAPETSKLADSTTTGAGLGMQQVPNVQQQLPNVQSQRLSTDDLSKGKLPQATPLQKTQAQGLPGNVLGNKVLPNGLGTLSLGSN